MGTHSFTKFKCGEIEAYYNKHYDGFLDHTGKQIIDFIMNDLDLPKMVNSVKNCALISLDELCKLDDANLLEKNSEFLQRHPALDRYTNPDVVLPFMQNSRNLILKSYPDEYAEYMYTIDLLKQRLIVSTWDDTYHDDKHVTVEKILGDFHFSELSDKTVDRLQVIDNPDLYEDEEDEDEF